MMEKVNLAQAFAAFNDYWTPRVVAELNGQQVKLAKLLGEFVWHHHETEDELFLVVQGTLVMQYRDREMAVAPGEFVVVPAGVEHRPVASDEVHVLLFEPKGTLNTGNVTNEHTVVNLQTL